MRPKAFSVARALDVGVVGDVDGLHGDAAAALECVGGLLRQRRVAVPDHHRRPGVEEALDDGAADTLRAAGHRREAAGKVDFVGHFGPPGWKLAKPDANGER